MRSNWERRVRVESFSGWVLTKSEIAGFCFLAFLNGKILHFYLAVCNLKQKTNSNTWPAQVLTRQLGNVV